MSRPAVLAALVLVLAAIPGLLAAPAQAQQGLPATVYVEDLEDAPTIIAPGAQVFVDLTVRYDYIVSADRTTITVAAAETPDWLSIEVRPDTFTVDPNPAAGSVTHQVTAIFEADPQAPAMEPARVTLHLEAQSQVGLSTSKNDQQWFVEAQYVPSISAEVEGRPIIVPRRGTTSATIVVTNLGNAPVLPHFRLTDIPEDLQIGIADEGRILGTESRHDDHDVRSRTTVVVRDLGDDWNHRVIPIEIAFRPIRSPQQASFIDHLDLVVFRQPASLPELVAFPAVAVGGVAYAGWWAYKQRQEIFWPDD